MLTGVLNIEKTSIHFLWQYLDTSVRIIWTLPFSVLTEDWRLLWQLTNQQTSRKNRKSIVPAKKKNLLSPRALHQTMGTSLKQNKYKHTAYKNKETSNSHLPLDTGKKLGTKNTEHVLKFGKCVTLKVKSTVYVLRFGPFWGVGCWRGRTLPSIGYGRRRVCTTWPQRSTDTAPRPL